MNAQPGRLLPNSRNRNPMVRFMPAVIGLAITVAAVYFWHETSTSGFEEQGVGPGPATEHRDADTRKHYCLERSGVDGIVFDQGSDCELADSVVKGDTLGVTVDSDGDAVTLTGYDL